MNAKIKAALFAVGGAIKKVTESTGNFLYWVGKASLVLAGAQVLFSLAGNTARDQADARRIYHAVFMFPNGPTLSTITGVHHRSDSEICFREMQSETDVCVHAMSFILTEVKQ